MDFLAEIVKRKREEVEGARRRRPLSEVKEGIRGAGAPRGFGAALTRGEGPRIIAEMKKASPSAGLLRGDFRPAALAGAFERGGAAAVSVLTDEGFFQGTLGHIGEARGAGRLPILRKDFILDEYQVYESRAAGADAFLLIAAILEGGRLRGLSALGESLGMDPLVEVHDRRDLDAALEAGAGVIGINNRDLRTFRTDVAVSLELVGVVPDGTVTVSESGISSRDRIESLRRAGVDAFLIGEALMRSPDVEGRLAELSGARTTTEGP